MRFQVISWESNDHLIDGSDAFCIDMFGRCADGNSVAARASFTPYFFIEVPRYSQKHNVYSDLEKMFSKRIMDEMSITLVDRKKFYGFTNNAAFRFAKLVFQSKKSFKSAGWVLSKSRKYKNAIYEANLDPMLRFIHLTGIQSAGWVEVESYMDADQKETSCDLEITVSNWKNVVPVAEDSIAPIVIASFDIETYSPDGSFPNPERPECPVIQIATTLQTYGQNGYTRHLHTLNECLPIENVQIRSFRTERELITSWCDLVKLVDPDVLVGYNIWKFDNVYLYKRADLLQITDMFCLNRYRSPSRHYKAAFSSGAYGDNNYDMVTSHGRFQIDLLELYKREHKLVKYSLNFVSEHFLGDHKVEMPIKEMFERYRNGTPEDMRKIGEYCVKDTELPLRLMDKLANIPNLVEMARATYVPMNFLLERGQQIKCFSQITKQTQLENMLVRTIQDGKTNESFVGATVLEAKTGAYMNAVITGLDFASLYPTIMRAHNLCYNSIVLDEKYNNLPGIEYKTVEWTTNKDSTHFKYTFAQSPTGILPKLLETLAKNRKQAKKDMANATDPFMKDVYNGKQLAFKVSMNSIYGFCSAFMLPCQAISACVTTIGREMIEQTKNLVEQWYPSAEVVYGDSVTGDTPLYLEKNGTYQIRRIDDLFYDYPYAAGQWAAKEYATPTGVRVFSDQGFTTIKRVMRHKTEKRLYRVITSAGIVDVTEDHSLLLPDGTPVAPGSISVGTELLQRIPEVHEDLKTIMGTYNGVPDTHGCVYTVQTKKQATELMLSAQANGYIGTTLAVRDDTFEVVVRASPLPRARVRKIIDLGRTMDYVYDLETENHHFHVGPGNLVVHNTDSVMVKFDTKDAKSDLEMREISFRLGEEAADRISKTFKYPIELEFEKCYQPYLLFSKKRYAGLMYTQVGKPDYIDAKGIQLVRRDNAPFVKDISKQVLNMIMYDQDVLGSIDKVQDVARKLLNYEFPVDQLVISKSMRNDYVNRNQPHLKVAEKIEQRNPGAGPKSGERVPYIIMDNGERLLCDRAEDPVYVSEKGLDKKVDVLYYLTNGLISPLESFYDLFMDHSKEGIFGEMIRAFENKRKGLRNGSTLTQFFERTKEAEKKTPQKKTSAKKTNKPQQQRTIDLFF